MKTQITILVLLFTLNTIYVNAQINTPKNNTVKNIKFNKTDKLKNLKLITGGNRGFVYQEGNLNKKIPNAEITFKSEDGKITKKIKTDSYGNYKITLKPGRYVVTVTHYKYTFYTTVSGFVVVNDKFGTFNIPLKRPLIKNNEIVSVFDSKTKKLKKHIRHEKISNYKKNDPNSIFIYTTLQKLKGGPLTMILHLDKQYIPRNKSRLNPSKTPTKTKPFVPNHKFMKGDFFEFNNQRYKVLSSNIKEIKLLKVA